MVIANMLDIPSPEANAMFQPQSMGYSMFSSSHRPVPGMCSTLARYCHIMIPKYDRIGF